MQPQRDVGILGRILAAVSTLTWLKLICFAPLPATSSK
jgi:hypothetical protein